MNIIDELDDFINQTRESKEVKRALAVKMILLGKSYHEIKELLNVSYSFISQWKHQALFHGVESLRLEYQDRKGFLNAQEKQETIEWLRAKYYLKLSDLQNYLQNEYDVVFESAQSYYNLLKEAGISWKKTQNNNPPKNDELVKAQRTGRGMARIPLHPSNKRKDIEELLARWEPEIQAENLTVFIIDEFRIAIYKTYT